jgi:hypothetical protein
VPPDWAAAKNCMLASNGLARLLFGLALPFISCSVGAVSVRADFSTPLGTPFPSNRFTPRMPPVLSLSVEPDRSGSECRSCQKYASDAHARCER